MMRLVVDSNVLFTYFWRNSALNRILDHDVKLFSPEYALTEIEKHREEIIEKAKMKENDFSGYFYLLKQSVDFAPKSSYERYLEEAEKVAGYFSDAEKEEIRDDADFLALSMALGCPLWSNDALLKKQGKVAVFSTYEIITLFSPKNPVSKKENFDDLIAWIKEKDKKFKGKREKIDYDLIAYGVSRNGKISHKR